MKDEIKKFREKVRAAAEKKIAAYEAKLAAEPKNAAKVMSKMDMAKLVGEQGVQNWIVQETCKAILNNNMSSINQLEIYAPHCAAMQTICKEGDPEKLYCLLVKLCNIHMRERGMYLGAIIESLP